MELAAKLADGRPIGTWVSMSEPGVAEVLAGQGFDFLTIDTEHASTTTETVENMVRAVEAAPGDTEALVRVAWNDPVRIKRVLDTGPAGVMAPQINDAEEARDLVRSCRYPPQGAAANGDPGSAVDEDGIRGRRGIAASRASEYGGTLDEYVRETGEDIAVIAQIETARAASAAEEIGSVPGIDALLVGPADLSAALGCFLEFDAPRFENAIEDTLTGAEAAGVPVGTLAKGEEQIDAWLDAGFDFLIAGTDGGYLADGAARAREQYEHRVDRESK